MFNVGGGELLAILLLALIVLGPDKLPHAAKQAGKYLSEFRRISSGFQDEIRNAMDLEGLTSTPSRRATPETRGAAVDTDLVPDPDAPARPEPTDATPAAGAPSGPDPVADRVPDTVADTVADTVPDAVPDPIPDPSAPAPGGDGPVRSPDAAVRHQGAMNPSEATTPDVVVEGPSGSFS